MSALQHVESLYGSSGFQDIVTTPEMMQQTTWQRKQLVQIKGILFNASCHAKKRVSETAQTILAGSMARSPGIEPICLRNSEQATHGLRGMICWEEQGKVGRRRLRDFEVARHKGRRTEHQASANTGLNEAPMTQLESSETSEQPSSNLKTIEALTKENNQLKLEIKELLCSL
ncbi:uncharacterized protein ATNIH1004_011693 [Aspergillus tanneri]|uniref:Uncharacterized protein n=1 Tax=Aspergillus tanneri TaxID=1220188 RepID=A0A5M9MEZ7_9EURO|nr:uncharacterized protein ATNIH1004_011693 [Aspergillus tanneri]KAA8641557.1 hypothetical protein ATNIH1004_011693 [Aspergillus tanneri]